MKLPLMVALLCFMASAAQILRTLKEKENLERRLVAEWKSKNIFSTLWKDVQDILDNFKKNQTFPNPEWSAFEELKDIIAELEDRDSAISEELKKQKSIHSTLIRTPGASELHQYHLESHAGRIPRELNDYLNDQWNTALFYFDDGLKCEISALQDQITTTKNTIQNLQKDIRLISGKSSSFLEKIIESTAFHLNLKIDFLTEHLKSRFLAFDSSFLNYATSILLETNKERK